VEVIEFDAGGWISGPTMSDQDWDDLASLINDFGNRWLVSRTVQCWHADPRCRDPNVPRCASHDPGKRLTAADPDSLRSKLEDADGL
jgi:hypothetical protein